MKNCEDINEKIEKLMRGAGGSHTRESQPRVNQVGEFLKKLLHSKIIYDDLRKFNMGQRPTSQKLL